MSSSMKSSILSTILPSCMRNNRDSITPSMMMHHHHGHLFVTPPPVADICGYVHVVRVACSSAMASAPSATEGGQRDSFGSETVENDNNALKHMKEEKVWAVLSENKITLSHPKNDEKIMSTIPLRSCMSLRVLTPRSESSSPRHHRRAFTSSLQKKHVSSPCSPSLTPCPSQSCGPNCGISNGAMHLSKSEVEEAAKAHQVLLQNNRTTHQQQLVQQQQQLKLQQQQQQQQKQEKRNKNKRRGGNVSTVVSSPSDCCDDVGEEESCGKLFDAVMILDDYGTEHTALTTSANTTESSSIAMSAQVSETGIRNDAQGMSSPYPLPATCCATTGMANAISMDDCVPASFAATTTTRTTVCVPEVSDVCEDHQPHRITDTANAAVQVEDWGVDEDEDKKQQQQQQAQHLLMLVTEADTYFMSFHDETLMYEWQTAITTSMMRN